MLVFVANLFLHGVTFRNQKLKNTEDEERYGTENMIQSFRICRFALIALFAISLYGFHIYSFVVVAISTCFFLHFFMAIFFPS